MEEVVVVINENADIFPPLPHTLCHAIKTESERLRFFYSPLLDSPSSLANRQAHALRWCFPRPAEDAAVVVVRERKRTNARANLKIGNGRRFFFFPSSQQQMAALFFLSLSHANRFALLVIRARRGIVFLPSRWNSMRVNYVLVKLFWLSRRVPELNSRSAFAARE